MLTINPKAARLHAEAFLKDHPDVQYLDAFMFDMNCIVRGKRYPRADIAHLFEIGMLLPYSAMVLDVTGTSSDAGGIGFSDGDPDGTLRPISATLSMVPWAGPGNHRKSGLWYLKFVPKAGPRSLRISVESCHSVPSG